MPNILYIPTQRLLLDGGRNGTIHLEDGTLLFALLPREQTEPYASRWFFNELLYCKFAQELNGPVQPAGVFDADGNRGIYRAPFGDRLIGCVFSATPDTLDTRPFQEAGYNIDKYYDVTAPDSLKKVFFAFRRLFVIDQLLWMLDRTPDNILGLRGPDGMYKEIRSIDHEHCLALNGDPKHTWNGVPADLSHCPPTQMTHFVDLSPTGLRESLQLARDLKRRLPLVRARYIAEKLLVFLTGFVGNGACNALEEHLKRTLDMYNGLWNALEDRLRDFFRNYTPLLIEQGRTP